MRNMRQIILTLIVFISTINVFGLSHKGTKYVKVGEEFTLTATPKQYTQSTAWLWGGNVIPETDIYGTTSAVTFKAISETPTTIPCVVQCTTYYFADGTTSSTLNKEIETWNVFVDEDSAGGDDEQTKLELSRYEYSLKKKAHFILTANVTPNGSEVKWSTDDINNDIIGLYYNDVYSVSVVGNNEGTASIICSANGITKRCIVTVTSGTINNGNATCVFVPASDKNMSMGVGQYYQIIPEFFPNHTTANLIWSSRDPGIVSVDDKGLLHARSEGETTITVTIPGIYDDYAHILVSGDVKYDDCEAVDLGLSVLWASKNIGAKLESEAGKYFMWGIPTHGYPDKSNNYFPPSINDYAYTPHDPAYVHYGVGWRTPSQAQFKELMNKCTWTWGGNGFRITGPSGKSIYLPVTSYDNSGHYWASDNRGHFYWWSPSGRKIESGATGWFVNYIRPVINHEDYSNVDEIEFEPNYSTIIYDLQGLTHDPNNLKSGIYIMKKGTEIKKILVK